MFEVRIIIETSHKSIRPADAFFWSIVEYMTKKGAATVEYKYFVPDATGNMLELSALAKALKALKRPCKAEIYTESRYINSVLTQGWLEKWQRNGWKTEKGEPVKHEKLWRMIQQEMAPHEVVMRLCGDHEYKKAMQAELKKQTEERRLKREQTDKGKDL